MVSESSNGPPTYAYLLDDWLRITGQSVPEIDSERWVSYNLDDLYPEWQLQAHCRGVGVEYYFGDDDEQPTMSIKQVRRAAKLCEVCPVYVECLTWALTTREEYGVWAGTSGRVRRRIFKMMDNGDTTVVEVVERFRNGQGDTYRLPGPQAGSTAQEGKLGAQITELPHDLGERDQGLRAADWRASAI
jgi:WhiB family transcriptional regulator, redox-sensing transcriptional regulator